jgi:hypothetical protein
VIVLDEEEDTDDNIVVVEQQEQEQAQEQEQEDPVEQRCIRQLARFVAAAEKEQKRARKEERRKRKRQHKEEKRKKEERQRRAGHEEEEVIVLDEEEEVIVLDEEEEVIVLDEEEDTDDQQEEPWLPAQAGGGEVLLAAAAAAVVAALVQITPQEVQGGEAENLLGEGREEDMEQQRDYQEVQQLQHSEAEALWQFQTEFVIKESTSTNVDCMICYSSNAAFVPQGCDHTESRGCESCLSRLRQCPFCREPFSALVNVITQEVVALAAGVPHGSPGEGDEASGNNLHQEADDQTSAFDSAVKCTECDGLDHENAAGEDTEFMLLCDAVTQEHGQDGRWKPCVLNGQYVPCPRGTHIRCCAPRPWPTEQVRCREDVTSAGDWFCEQCREDHEAESYPLVAAHHLPAEPGRHS